MNHFLPSAVLGVLLLLSYSLSPASASASATAYFPTLTTDEKEEYSNWIIAHSSSYSRHVFMPSAVDEEDGVAMFWNIEGDTVHFAVAVRAEGWVGFGVSEAGGMIGADMALFKASNPTELVDAHVIEDRSMPLTDDCQDWTLEGAPTGENGWMIVEMSRLLDTQDTQDHTIKKDADLWSPPTRIIAAWGDGDSISYHGEKKARSSVRIFANHSNELTERQVLLETLVEESDGHFDFLEDEFLIPVEETYYKETCRTFNELNIELPEGQSMVTMIGAVPVLTQDTAKFVHHFTVHLQKDCTAESALTGSTLYGWAPGDEGWALPNDVGFPAFENENNQAVMIEIHYDNPSFKPEMKDSSGMRFYYTHGERTHRAGILLVGDPGLSLVGEKIDEGLTQYEFTCPGACSSSLLGRELNGENQGVTIISEILHMHQTGVRMTNEVIRGDEVFHKAVADVYDFEQQGGHRVSQDSYEVLPGDSFRTTCYYKDGVAFGLASKEEMCIAFIMYYPAKRSAYGQPWICPHEPGADFGTGCEGELEYVDLNGVDDLGREFGDSSGECAATPSTNTSTTESLAGQPSSAPNKEPATITLKVPSPTTEPTSGADWLGLSLLLPSAAVLLVVLLA
mmetsp:Transcript_27190/g.58257  ORF Transcript_27190/g.58257 Transcript_27190/m.58257 type:complete len:624 (-) Transcript_27190:387-2258(-)